MKDTISIVQNLVQSINTNTYISAGKKNTFTV